MLRPVKSAESLQRSEPAKDDNNQTEQGKDSRPVSMDLDDVGPLETVSKAVGNIIAARAVTDSPKCHSRSSSHDSYFERKLSVQFKDDSDKKSESELDLSEIQMNFDLEENEMRIFSEDEAMLSASVGSDLSRSLLDEPVSPKARLSFREKFKRFTSPTSHRKTDHSETFKDKLVGALSPESLRKRSEMLLAEKSARSKPIEVSPTKKKKSNFSPGSSPKTNLVKRSKIETDEETTALTLPLSPSIKFMDESTDSTTKLNIDGKFQTFFSMKKPLLPNEETRFMELAIFMSKKLLSKTC